MNVIQAVYRCWYPTNVQWEIGNLLKMSFSNSHFWTTVNYLDGMIMPYTSMILKLPMGAVSLFADLSKKLRPFVWVIQTKYYLNLKKYAMLVWIMRVCLRVFFLHWTYMVDSIGWICTLFSIGIMYIEAWRKFEKIILGVWHHHHTLCFIASLSVCFRLSQS